MSFTDGVGLEIGDMGAGEVLASHTHDVLTYKTFEDGLIWGRFAKYDTNSVDNLDSSATPRVVGVPIRQLTGVVGDNTYSTDRDNAVEVCKMGYVSVEVVSGDTPVKDGIVYAVNDGAIIGDLGKATTVVTNNILLDARFERDLGNNNWLIVINKIL